MNNATPLIGKGWLRVVVFCSCYLMMIIIASVAMGLLIPELEAGFQEFGTGIIFSGTGSLLLFWFFRRFFDRKATHELGFSWKGFGAERWTGILMALVLLCTLSLLLWLMGFTQWFYNDPAWMDMLLVALLMILVAFAEEVVFRGYILANLMESMGKETALVVSAFLFAFFHSLNPDYSLIGFINIFLAGILLGINFLFSRNLWFAITFHFMWNFFQGPILGFEVSGISLPSLLLQDMSGPDYLTGGKFGLEGSMLTTLMLSAAGLLLYKYYRDRNTSTHS